MNEEKLGLVLLIEVINLWQQLYTTTEIGSDLHKIEILELAKESLHHRRHEMPPEVLDLYKKVYLRDVWTCP